MDRPSRLVALLASAWLAAFSCGTSHPPGSADGADPAARTPRLLLIGLDGADWQVLDPLLSRGELPNLAGLIRDGVRAPLRTITPALSPVVWTSIATGVGPEKHGIWDFLATRPGEARPSPVRSHQRQAPALWGILDAAGIRSGVVGWWATFPAEPIAGFIVSDRVAASLFDSPSRENALRPGAVHPAALAAQVAALVRSPAEISDREVRRYLHVGAAGPLPEAAHRRVEQLRTLLASSDSYAAIAAQLARRERPEFLAVYLEGTDTIAHLFMPFAPPRRHEVSADEALWFGEAVTEYYRHADELVGALVEAAGPGTDVLICSDHGFKSGAARPFTDARIETGRAADWHRREGILILKGPAFRRGIRIEVASVLDVAPTVLRLFGLPSPADFEGSALEKAFDRDYLRAHPVGARREGRPAPGQDGPGRTASYGAPEAWTDTASDRDQLEKLASLGYLQRHGSRSNGEETANALNNRGLALLERGDVDGAIRELRRAARLGGPGSFAKLNLARALLAKRELDESETILRGALEANADVPEAHTLLGKLLAERGDLASAHGHLRRALRRAPNSVEALLALGRLEESAGNLDSAAASYAVAARVSPEDPEAWNDLGRLDLARRNPREAAAQFRHALEADARHAPARANLALALEAMGDAAGAEREFRRAVADSPVAEIRSDYGAMLYSQHRWREAREMLEGAVRLDPGCAPAWNNLGAVLAATGAREQALEAYRRAVFLDPAYRDARRNLGMALLALGAVVEGEAQLRTALSGDGEESRPYAAPVPPAARSKAP